MGGVGVVGVAGLCCGRAKTGCHRGDSCGAVARAALEHDPEGRWRDADAMTPHDKDGDDGDGDGDSR